MDSKNVQYIDSKRIINKYELTPLIESGDILDNFYRETLKDFTPDAPTLASDEQRKNTDSISKLNVRQFGRRAPKEAFAPDLFLGDTTKDNRSIHNGPMMGDYQKQIWHRKDNFKKSFKNDADNSIPSEGISEGKMMKNKISTYKGFKERYKNFEESTDSWITGYNMKAAKISKVNNSEFDNTIADLNDVADLKSRRDYITALSNQALPKGWDSTPDHKIKIARYTKNLKSKNLNDVNFMKNREKQSTDTKIIDRSDMENNLVTQLSTTIDGFKNKKKETFKVGVSNFKSSKISQFRNINKSKEYLKNKELENTEMSDKKSSFAEEISKSYTTNTNVLDVRKIISDFSGDRENYKDGKNLSGKENFNTKSQSQKELLTDILRKSIISNNTNYLDKGNNKTLSNNASRDASEDIQHSKFIYNNSEINKNILNKPKEDFEVFNYKTKKPELFSNYENDKSGVEKTLSSTDKEKMLEQRSLGNQQSEIQKAENFENDTDFSKSGEVNMAAGTVGNMGSKYMFKDKEYEDSISEHNNVNDRSISIKRSIY